MPVVARQSKSVKQRYVWAVNAFHAVAGVKDKYSEDEVSAAVERLEEKYSPSTVGSIFKVCKAKLPGWPEGLIYRFSPSDVSQVVARTSNVEKMIKAVMESGDSVLTGHLLLSTVYGLRCSELAATEPGDLNLEKGTFFARTKKGGVQREHAIPKDLEPIFRSIVLYQQSRQSLSIAFRRIEAMAGIKHEDKGGWHSIRRALATGLAEAKADPTIAKKFMRWKDGTMYEHYVVFGYAVDREIFEIHPFIPIWKRMK